MEKSFWIIIFFTLTTGWAYRIARLRQSLAWMPWIDPHLRPQNPGGRISVIVPMRNEEANARACLEALLKQDYPDFEIIAVDDHSTDRTGEIIQTMVSHPEPSSTGHPEPRRGEGSLIYVKNQTPTPEGWTGKNFAVQQGLSEASGEWLLFTDADTRHEPASLSAAMAHAQAKDLQFLTLLPRCLCESFAEKTVQPIAMALLGLWFPIRKINDPHSKIYFGNGQYLMIQRKLYEKLGGHAAVRGEFLEDFALARKVKEAKSRGECALGKSIYGTRMYASSSALWRGWRRIYLHAFRKNTAALFLLALETFFFSVLPFAALFWPSRPVEFAGPFILIILILWIVSWRAYRIVDADPKYALLHPFAAFLIMLYLLDAAWISVSGKKTVWR